MKKWVHLLPGILLMLLGMNNVFSQNACPLPDVGTASISKSTACEGEAFTLTYSFPAVNAGYMVTVNSPLSIAGSYAAIPASFGPVLAAPLTGNLVLANPSNACGSLTNAAEINGNIAVINRGQCAFVTKVMEAQNAGAIAVIVVNNQPGIVGMFGTDPNITIPALSISQADGAIIKNALNNGPVNMTINPFSRQIWQAWDDASFRWINQGPAGGDLVLTAENPGTTFNGQPGDRFRVKVSNACGDSYSNEVEIIYGILGVAYTNATTVCEGSQFTISYNVPNVNDGYKVTLNSPLSAAGSYAAVPASFGPVLAAPLTGNLVLANPSNACGSLTNAAEINGNIAVINRGQCAFVTKVMEAQNAGAIAVIVVNNQPGIGLMGGSNPNITIPALMISQADGAIIKNALNNGPVNMTINPFARQIWQAWDDASSSWITQGAAGGDFVAMAANPGTTINGLPGDRYRVKVDNVCGESYSNEIEIMFVNQPVSGVASSSASAVCIGGPFTLSYSVANEASLSVNSPSSIAGSYSFNPGLFSNALPVPLNANLVLANPGNACSPLINAAAVNGKIAVIDRGTCSFISKVMQAQNAGAIAVIIINNGPGNLTMSGADPHITIPWVSISQEDGALIKAALNDGPVNVTINPFIRQVWEVWDDNSSKWLRFANAGGDRLEIAGNPQTTINGLPGDRFRVVSYNAGCAIFSNELEIAYVSYPVVSITAVPSGNIYTGGDPNTIYLGYGPQSVTLQTSVDMNVSYQWTGSGLNCLDCANPVFTPTAPGTYTFDLYAANEYGCGTNTSITITVKDVRVPGKKGKVYICHQNKSVSQTLEINTNAVQDHLNHGDALGNCAGGGPRPGGKKKSAEEVEVVVGITVYPNPATNQVIVAFETEKAEPYTLRMTDITGRTVSAISGKSNAGKNQVPVNVSSWVPGTYLFILQNGSAMKTAKVIKQ